MLVSISVVDATMRPDPYLAEKLMHDVSSFVDNAVYAARPACAGAKAGGVIPDVATLVVTVITSKAAISLIDVLKSYLMRNGGKLVIKGSGEKEITVESGNLNSLESVILTTLKS